MRFITLSMYSFIKFCSKTSERKHLMIMLSVMITERVFINRDEFLKMIDFELNLISVNYCYHMRSVVTAANKSVCIYISKREISFFLEHNSINISKVYIDSHNIMSSGLFQISGFVISTCPGMYKLVLASVQINSNQMTSCVDVVRL